MTGFQVLHTAFSFLPFVVCLFWLFCFLVHHKKNDAPKFYYMTYIATCVILYLCHALYFTMGLPHEMECLWTLCSLSVYPLFYAYICRLTSNDFSICKLLPWLAPGAFVALAKYIFPDTVFDKVRMFLFLVQIVCVCYYGIKRLKEFDMKLQAVYADMEGRDTTAVAHLLKVIILVSILSGIANSTGKQFFGESLWLLIPISIAFSTLLFALSYICFNRDFTIDTLNTDAEASMEESQEIEDETYIGKKIETLMISQHYFLKKDLKISDVVREIGSNRTYVSSYFNRTYQCSFSDYMNKLRIEYAKKLIIDSRKSMKLSQIAEESGFANEQSFYRNFKKFSDMTPSEWLIAFEEENGK